MISPVKDEVEIEQPSPYDVMWANIIGWLGDNGAIIYVPKKGPPALYSKPVMIPNKVATRARFEAAMFILRGVDNEL